MHKKWDEKFLREAVNISKWSKDSSTKVGCVIVKNDKTIIATGYNGLPRGCDDTPEHHPERHDREQDKYKWYEHAERNAIYNAARHGTSLMGGIAYVTVMHPCADCARALVQAGIKRVVWQEPNDPETAKRWSEQTKIASQILFEAGVVTTSLQLCPESQQ